MRRTLHFEVDELSAEELEDLVRKALEFFYHGAGYNPVADVTRYPPREK